MSEMIERVAKAISDTSDHGCPWDSVNKEQFRKYARAAIEAMRDPTVAMAGVDCPCTLGRVEATIKDVWQQMIDEALKDNGEE